MYIETAKNLVTSRPKRLWAVMKAKNKQTILMLFRISKAFPRCFM
jgi:hypothetical protein